MYNHFKEIIKQELDYRVTDVCFDGMRWFDWSVDINDATFEFTGCFDEKTFDEVYAVHGDIKAYVGGLDALDQMLFRIDGYVFSLQEIYESLFLQAQNEAHDLYNDGVIEQRNMQRHHDSCVIDMRAR